VRAPPRSSERPSSATPLRRAPRRPCSGRPSALARELAHGRCALVDQAQRVARARQVEQPEQLRRRGRDHEADAALEACRLRGQELAQPGGVHERHALEVEDHAGRVGDRADRFAQRLHGGEVQLPLERDDECAVARRDPVGGEQPGARHLRPGDGNLEQLVI
jgi:hypothetical protein